MFEQSLLDVAIKKNAKKPVSVLLSFLLETVIIFILVLIPLIYTEALPRHQVLAFLMAPPPPPPPPPPPVTAATIKVVARLMQRQEFVQPKAIPKQVAIVKEDPLPPQDQMAGVEGGIASGFYGSGADILGMMGGGAAPPPPPPPPPPERVRVGGQVQSARLSNQTRPVYPPLARQARIQGKVMLEAIIAKDGSVQELVVTSGHPLLIKAATDAVSQWRYQPTLLNGVPVEVITTIEVNFTLGG